MLYTLRVMRRNPGFTAAAVLTLGIGIGANSAVFSVLNTVLLRGLPYKNAGRIVALYAKSRAKGLSKQLVSIPDYFDWKAANIGFESMAAWNFKYFNLTGTDEAERVEGLTVTSEFFPILGVQAVLGRTFQPEEE